MAGEQVRFPVRVVNVQRLTADPSTSGVGMHEVDVLDFVPGQVRKYRTINYLRRAVGFIGSDIVAALAARAQEVVVCYRFGSDDRWRNLAKHEIAGVVAPEALFDWLGANHDDVETVIHMGADIVIRKGGRPMIGDVLTGHSTTDIVVRRQRT